MAQFKRAHLIISGHVQGVFFRANAKKIADSLSLTGWARNLPSGQVEIYIMGEFNPVQKMINWCHEGPERAEVTEVEVTWDKNLGDFTSFEVK
ncbi:MAG: acylphosphatase [Deltaproteobacteria bacterium GWA2_38_16]|nr:MAG: acylphosphatase [Deltaproteobacteria bacterium GWA2_38_16]OGQ03362.1 MAG: acylphosphatase [Deltaproteobacteria bacterium RIFCSPHIGHO2_02_FULL_38_15]OGQ33509.1 MAG: acylphosphatase [Deltaproteobacteria bacterium RIFCSPLOWO2_01_FULL_38_9]OGQ59534.1 MAG: acylphosphatase [Deltaproteobacteria bacterium RIFCSPLOWO2_12_FULL_38_8]HBQ20633.1 acylphosphatase [Deltaproteobacteria bacterium]